MSARVLAPAPPVARALAVPGFGMLQRRLAVGETNDPLEREADRLAANVVASPAPRPVKATGRGGPAVRRACAECEEEDRVLRRDSLGAASGVAPPSVAATLRSSGAPLPPAVRGFMEPRFAADFSNVRVHCDSAAAQSAAEVNARAYTVGHHVVFGEGQYAPHSSEGRKLIAHELVHVVQQDDPHTPAERGVVRRQSLGERFRAGVSDVVAFVAPDQAQFASDLVASVQESPSHVGEFITGELWDTIREHWPSILGVTVVLLGSQAIVAALGAAPTGVSQVVAAILEIIVLAILLATVAVETYSAIQQGIRWWDAARAARGTPAGISAASREFVRMVWHILMIVLALAGVRGRLSSGAAARVSAPFEPPPPPPPPPPALRVISGGAPGRVPMSGGRVVSTPRATSPTTSAPPGGARLAAGGGGASPAPTLVPEVAPPPVEVPPLRVVPDLPASPGATSPTAGPAALGTAGALATAGATATALATDSAERERRSDCGPLPITWPSELPVPEETGIILTRTNAGTREWEGIDDRGPSQQALAREIRAARSLPLLEMDLENPPFPVCGNDVFEPGVDYDAHHIHPLFLGGGDYEDNLCALSHAMHVAGHRRLNDQSAWIDTYRQCGIESGTLTRHPQMTEYIIADES
jgi:hypothetical protein